MNESCIRLFGVEQEKFQQGNIYSKSIFADPQEPCKAIKQIKVDGFLRDYPVDLITTEGKIRHLLGSGSILNIGEGNLAIGSYIDVTERRQTEASILRAKKEWEETFDAIIDIVTLLNENKEIVRANKATVDATG